MDTEVELDDELLGEFINESREHLTTIEADLLAIEEGGANIDVELVNKVFRAAHSIKGASGFFGLTRVKELAHKAETVLDMMRSKKMTPNAEITNLLLAAFDQLREMINHPKESAGADINELLVNLTGLTSSYLPQGQKASLAQTVTLQAGQGSPVIMPRLDFERSREQGRYLCAIEYDLIHDIERQGRNVLEVFHALSLYGEIVDCELKFESAGTLDDPIGNQLPVRLIFSTEFKPDELVALFPYNRNKIKLLSEPSENAPTAAAPLGTEPQKAKPAPALPPLPAAAVVEAYELQPNPSPAAQAEPLPAALAASRPNSPPASATPSTVVEDSIRVNVATLEMLMNLAGELVLGRNQLRASIAQKNPARSQGRRPAHQPDHLRAAGCRHADPPSAHRQRVRQISAPGARSGFDILHKDIQFDIRGKDVALDRSLIESLSDPLTHMVRNAVDHGIETPGRPRPGGQGPSGHARDRRPARSRPGGGRNCRRWQGHRPGAHRRK